MIKDYKYAGTFYPEDKSELLDLIESFEEKEPKYHSKAVIVPHAGFIYSGKLTARGINHLDKKTKNMSNIRSQCSADNPHAWYS